jgi:hypothetical protein
MINFTESQNPKYEEGYLAARTTDISIGKNPYKALTADWSSWNNGSNHGDRDKKIDRIKFQDKLQQATRAAKASGSVK